MCLGEVVELVAVGVHAAGGNLVQQRLPHVRARALDERDLGLVLAAELVAELGDELEPAGAAADDEDAVQARRARRHGGGGRRAWRRWSRLASRP